MDTFERKFKQKIYSSMENNYKVASIPFINDNLQESKRIKNLKTIKKDIKNKIRLSLKLTKSSKFNFLTRKLNISELSFTYDLLNDDYSRETFILLLAYIALGPKKVKLPLQNKTSWQKILEIERKCKKNETCQAKQQVLDLLDLNPLGYNVRLFYKAEGVFTNYFLKQYEYGECRVEKNDYVIDGGACFGDTALQFAEAVGDKGRVFSFEFIKDNVKVFNENLALNPELKERVTIFENALWSNSDAKLYVVEKGPGSIVSMEKPDFPSQKIHTKSIDDLVKNQEIPKVNFIKLDIEGAEFECLLGARETISKFKPKLAICIYHDIDHFTSIPKLVKEFVPEYELYLDHHSANRGETVIYAICK